MGRVSSECRGVLTDRLYGGAEFSHAHWFFGNLYGPLVKIPNRAASAEDSPGLSRPPFEAGSPGRYYAPIAPLNVPLAAATIHHVRTGRPETLAEGVAGGSAANRAAR